MRYLLDTGIAQAFIGRDAKVLHARMSRSGRESDRYLHPGVG